MIVPVAGRLSAEGCVAFPLSSRVRAALARQQTEKKSLDIKKKKALILKTRCRSSRSLSARVLKVQRPAKILTFLVGLVSCDACKSANHPLLWFPSLTWLRKNRTRPDNNRDGSQKHLIRLEQQPALVSATLPSSSPR